jgi:ABC-type lipoprotein export system ATPase subunit
MPDVPAGYALEMLQIEKQYGALRPFRLRELRLERGGRTALVGVDARAAEVFVNLATGAILPDEGSVSTLGQRTSSISNSDEWLAFVEKIGFVSDRIVLLGAMTVAQNLALPFDLQLDPIPTDIRARVMRLASDIGLSASVLDVAVEGSTPLVRAMVGLGRALALEPELLLLEHPTATLSKDESRAYAEALRRALQDRQPAVVALTMDDRMGKGIGGRLCEWRPATGELVERRRWF